MSRHQIVTEPFEVVVGWDGPLQTFFIEVSKPAKDGDETEEALLWLGRQKGELPTVAHLKAALTSHAAVTSHAELTEYLWQHLQKEKMESAPPTPLQKEMMDMFSCFTQIE